MELRFGRRAASNMAARLNTPRRLGRGTHDSRSGTGNAPGASSTPPHNIQRPSSCTPVAYHLEHQRSRDATWPSQQLQQRGRRPSPLPARVPVHPPPTHDVPNTYLTHATFSTSPRPHSPIDSRMGTYSGSMFVDTCTHTHTHTHTTHTRLRRRLHCLFGLRSCAKPSCWSCCACGLSQPSSHGVPLGRYGSRGHESTGSWQQRRHSPSSSTSSSTWSERVSPDQHMLSQALADSSMLRASCGSLTLQELQPEVGLEGGRHADRRRRHDHDHHHPRRRRRLNPERSGSYSEASGHASPNLVDRGTHDGLGDGGCGGDDGGDDGGGGGGGGGGARYAGGPTPTPTPTPTRSAELDLVLRRWRLFRDAHNHSPSAGRRRERESGRESGRGRGRGRGGHALTSGYRTTPPGGGGRHHHPRDTLRGGRITKPSSGVGDTHVGGEAGHTDTCSFVTNTTTTTTMSRPPSADESSEASLGLSFERGVAATGVAHAATRRLSPLWHAFFAQVCVVRVFASRSATPLCWLGLGCRAHTTHTYTTITSCLCCMLLFFRLVFFCFFRVSTDMISTCVVCLSIHPSRPPVPLPWVDHGRCVGMRRVPLGGAALGSSVTRHDAACVGRVGSPSCPSPCESVGGAPGGAPPTPVEQLGGVEGGDACQRVLHGSNRKVGASALEGAFGCGGGDGVVIVVVIVVECGCGCEMWMLCGSRTSSCHQANVRDHRRLRVSLQLADAFRRMKLLGWVWSAWRMLGRSASPHQRRAIAALVHMWKWRQRRALARWRCFMFAAMADGTC